MTRMETLYPSTGRRAKTIGTGRRRPGRGIIARWLNDGANRVQPTQENDLQALMSRFELLIERVEQLKRQNALLVAQEKSWREERAHLIEKNEIAKRKVESMIIRLKALEQDS